ncbi:MAG TPA: ubiquitin-like small modifier protein 1 [Blastocatellia bacterium]|nr:ubiquitin-like small modifier protein 1 [Blastocatellia bacterium]
MAITVRIPQPLRRFTNNLDLVEASGRTIRDLFHSLEKQFPGITERLFDETGQLRRFVNIYVNGEDIRFLDGLTTEVTDGAEVSIVPAVAGGKG